MGPAPQRPTRLHFRPAGVDWEYANGSGPLQYGQGRAGGRREHIACSGRESLRFSCPGRFTGQGRARSFTCKSTFFSRACGLAFSKASEFVCSITICRSGSRISS
jgi:hypothetical protein